MGEKFTVQAWTQVMVNSEYPGRIESVVPVGKEQACGEHDDAPEGQERTYRYITHYQGKSFFAALRRLITLKREGYGCVKLEWR